MWDLKAGSSILLRGHTSVCALTDGRVVSGYDQTLHVEVLKTGSSIELRGHTSKVLSVCALADGRVVSGSYDGTLRVWDLKTRSSVELKCPILQAQEVVAANRAQAEEVAPLVARPSAGGGSSSVRAPIGRR